MTNIGETVDSLRDTAQELKAYAVAYNTALRVLREKEVRLGTVVCDEVMKKDFKRSEQAVVAAAEWNQIKDIIDLMERSMRAARDEVES